MTTSQGSKAPVTKEGEECRHFEGFCQNLYFLWYCHLNTHIRYPKIYYISFVIQHSFEYCPPSLFLKVSLYRIFTPYLSLIHGWFASTFNNLNLEQLQLHNSDISGC